MRPAQSKDLRLLLLLHLWLSTWIKPDQFCGTVSWFTFPRRNDAQSFRSSLSSCIFFCPYTLPKEPEGYSAAPLPLVIVNAQKVFLSNGGGSDLAYDAFYSAMKSWGKYQIAGSPDDANLIIELAYRVVDRETRVWSSTNTYNGVTDVHSREITDPQLVLTIYDAKTKNSLWSTIDHRRLARREKNREKETIIRQRGWSTN